MWVQQRIPFVGTRGYRLFCNVFNAGIASLTLYSILQGIFEIAGSTSRFVDALLIAGIALSVLGLGVFIALLLQAKNAQRSTGRRRQSP